MSDKVYILTRGHYSDYEIIGVETDKKRAKRIARIMSSTWYGGKVNVEEWEVGALAGITDKFPDDTFLYAVWEASTWTHGEKPVEGFRVKKVDPTSSRGVKAPNEVTYYEREDYHSVYVWAKDEAHARKIARDLIAEYRAQKAGIS